MATYLYDAKGNLTKKDDGTNVHAYGYDFRNLMTSYDGPGTTNDSTYTYDAEARRVTKNVNGSKTAYAYDFWNVVADYDGSNQLQATYVTLGLDGNLTVTRSGSTYTYLQDGIGSIRQLLAPDETTANAYDYDAFGETYGTSTENVTNRYRFTGREWDAESSLFHLRARTYAAQNGRFLARDPAGFADAVNLYAYVANQPTYWGDPLGLGRTHWYNPLDYFDPTPRNPRDWNPFDTAANVVYGGGDVGASARTGAVEGFSDNYIRRGAYCAACNWCMKKADELAHDPQALKVGEGVRYEAAASLGLAAEVGCEIVKSSLCCYSVYAYTSGGLGSPGGNVKAEIFRVWGGADPANYAGFSKSVSVQAGWLVGASISGSYAEAEQGTRLLDFSPHLPATLGGGVYLGMPGLSVSGVRSEYRSCGSKCTEPTR